MLVQQCTLFIGAHFIKTKQIRYLPAARYSTKNNDIAGRPEAQARPNVCFSLGNAVLSTQISDPDQWWH